MSPAPEVRIREVGPRDGLQNVDLFMPTEAKAAWIEAEARAGLREIEVCSLVPAKLIPQFADAGPVLAHALGIEGLTPVALIPNLEGARRGVELGVAKLVFVLSASESHNRANVRRPVADSLDDFARIAALRDGPNGRRFELVGAIATSFGCALEGSIDEARVCALAARLAERGADAILLGDTVGYADPARVRRRIDAVGRAVAPLPLIGHFHDTRGLGLANALAAFEAGVRILDASLGGLGGCPYAPGATGNIVTEDLAYMFESMGIATGIDLDRLLAAREVVARALPSVELHGHLARAGLPKGFAASGAARARDPGA